MPLRYLLDENVRGVLWRTLLRHNSIDPEPLDFVRVGDFPALPFGSLDPDILIWAERENRVLLSLDASSMPPHLQNHLAAGRHCPGIFVIRLRCSLPQLVAFLVEAAYRGDPLDWQDRIEHIP